MNERPTVVFAGGGHAHLYSLLRTAQMADHGYDVVLVNPSPYLYYSGMATGVISGLYTPEEDRIDVRNLVESGGGRFVEANVKGVLPEDRELLLDDGRRLPYDVASFCLGSGVDSKGLPPKEGVPVKPVENTAEIRSRIVNKDPDVLVVGGGAAGCEVAANAASLISPVRRRRTGNDRRKRTFPSRILARKSSTRNVAILGGARRGGAFENPCRFLLGR